MPRCYFRLTASTCAIPAVMKWIDDDVARRATLEILAQTVDSRSENLLDGEPYVVEARDGDGRLVYRLTVQAEKG